MQELSDFGVPYGVDRVAADDGSILPGVRHFHE
jgi:hypothetical protein